MSQLADYPIWMAALAVLWFAYLYAGYPLILGLIALATKRPRFEPAAYTPMVSVLIAARNEESDIGWKIEETLAWNYPPERLEILVGSDASDDRTDEIVSSYGDPRVRLIRMERRGGKGRVLNRLAKLAGGDILFFTDANSHVGCEALRLMTAHFADAKVGCVTGHSYSGIGPDSPVAETGTAVYWGHELLIKRLESRFGGVLACDGAIFCIRRDLYQDVSPELANDLELPLRIYDAGYKICFEPNARVLEQDTAEPGQEFARRRRICAQGALAMVRLRHTLKGRRTLQFFSHKVLRWLTLVPMLMALFSSAWMIDRPVFAALFYGQVVFYIAALFGGIQAARSGAVSRWTSIPLYIVVSAVGAFTGVCDAILGRRFDIWQSPSLTRGSNGSTASRTSA